MAAQRVGPFVVIAPDGSRHLAEVRETKPSGRVRLRWLADGRQRIRWFHADGREARQRNLAGRRHNYARHRFVREEL